MDAFLSAVAAAATGDQKAIAAITPVLDAAAVDPNIAPLATALRRILDGERDPHTLTTDLDPDAAANVRAVLDPPPRSNR